MQIMISESRVARLSLGAALFGGVLLAACGGDGPAATPSPAPTTSPAPTPEATPSPTPVPAPSPTPTPVLSACETVPELPTSVSDQANLYTISVPAGWSVVTDEGAMGVQLSRIILESADFSRSVDEAAEGPFTPIYYETGATLVIHVMNTAPGPPYHTEGVISESHVTIDGVTAPYHVFTEPSTAAGQLLDAHANYAGNFYLFYMGYNPDTCPAGEDLFRAMLASFRFQ